MVKDVSSRPSLSTTKGGKGANCPEQPARPHPAHKLRATQGNAPCVSLRRAPHDPGQRCPLLPQLLSTYKCILVGYIWPPLPITERCMAKVPTVQNQSARPHSARKLRTTEDNAPCVSLRRAPHDCGQRCPLLPHLLYFRSIRTNLY